MATIKEVAAAAGVSISTVSRAFNNYSDINGKTKERILEAARSLDYSPNISARNLSSKKRLNLGLIISGFLNENARNAKSMGLFLQYAWLKHGFLCPSV